MGEGDMPAADAFESMDLGFMSKAILFMAVIAGLCALFLAITFIQSALNKMFDYKGNRSYFDSQFEKSVLKNLSGILLPIVLLLELVSGLTCSYGIIELVCYSNSDWIGLGCMLGALTFLCLLFGQRVTKDYAGAATITGYFIVALIGIIGSGLS